LLAPFLRARSKLTESDIVTLFSLSTEEMAQRALRESSQGSNKGDRENDTLTRALGTVEQRGRVRGVSSKLTWREDFPKLEASYRKRKTTSPLTVDIEELKRQLKRELYGDLEVYI
jgi:hypothetical protein